MIQPVPEAMRYPAGSAAEAMSVARDHTAGPSYAASRLGGHMALLYSEDLGQAEKLRPYALPADGWLTWAAERLAERASQSPLPLASAP